MTTTVHIDGNGPGRVFEGIGGVTSNGMTRLLRDYPPRQQQEILDYLFRPQFGASLHVLKVEIGSDANGTAGTEPSHMRSEQDFDITRGVGLWFARQAKDRNPHLLLDAIRWGTPRWITNNEQKYLYYKNFLDGARVHFGLDFNYLAPDENEGSYSPRWVTEVLRPRLDADGYRGLKLTGADSNTDWNIAPVVKGDRRLRGALYAISAHYHEDTPDSARNCGLPIFNSEDLAPYRHHFSCALDMAHKIIQSYASGRMVQYQMHPVIEAIYDSTPYSCKSILTAAQPWSGHYRVEPGLWVTAQFTQFMQPGWQYLDEGCWCDRDGGCLALRESGGAGFTIVVLNRSAQERSLRFQLEHLAIDRLHVWITTEREQFVQRGDLSVEQGIFETVLPANSVCTFTTTTGQRKGAFEEPPPAPEHFPLPYMEDFQSYAPGGQPRYAVDQGGAFELFQESSESPFRLRQLISPATRPIDWRLRATPEPYTILGEQEMRNYQVSVRACMEELPSPDCEGYILLGARCNLAPLGNVPAECYNLCVFHNGQWHLRRGPLVLVAGLLEGFAPHNWHTLALRCQDDRIQAILDGVLLAQVQDESIPSGQVVLGSGYHQVQYEDLRIEPLDDCPYCLRFPAMDPRLQMRGSWRETGSSSNHYMRTLMVSGVAGDTLEFSFDGTAVCVLGMKDKSGGRIRVELDGMCVERDTWYECPLYRESLFTACGLASGAHRLRMTVTGEQCMNAIGTLVHFNAVEVSGGSGLL